MSMKDFEPTHAVLVGRLSIERCQTDLAHLRALIHFCQPDHKEGERLVCENMRRIITHIEQEIGQCAKALALLE